METKEFIEYFLGSYCNKNLQYIEYTIYIIIYRSICSGFTLIHIHGWFVYVHIKKGQENYESFKEQRMFWISEIKEELVTIAVEILYMKYYKFYFNSSECSWSRGNLNFSFLIKMVAATLPPRETKLEKATGLQQRTKLGHRDGIDSFFFLSPW